jgi:hypothetical protein
LRRKRILHTQQSGGCRWRMQERGETDVGSQECPALLTPLRRRGIGVT